MLNAASAREADLALLRVMGASPAQVFGTIMVEGLVTAIVGGVMGLLLGHAALAVATDAFAALGELGLRPWQPNTAEVGILVAVIAIGLAAALVPALRVFRIDLAASLAKAS